MTDTQDTATQALPTPGAGERMDHVAITSIARSLTNPRKHFDPVKLQELADSIAAGGVHQPILIRPLPAHRLEDTHREARALKQPAPEYELVAGERRWRACQLARVTQVPAMIRPMTDAQALEAQVIENLQREDVTELEEAEGYRVLMDSQGISMEDVARKIGKSKSYVHTRIKILDLCQEGQQALRDGSIDFSCALPIARIPSEQLQIKALEEALEEDYDGNRMSARAVKQMVRDDYMLQLASAPFDIADKTLCPKAGACGDCLHRTGANPDLFDDVDSADVCTNPPCFHAKEEAHAAQVRTRAEQLGAEIIDGREAKELLPSAYTTQMDGYLRLDNKIDSPIPGKTLRSLIGEVMAASNVQPTIVVNPHNSKEMIAVLRPEQAHALIVAAGHTKAQEKLEADQARQAEYNREADELENQFAFEKGWRNAVFSRVMEQLLQPSQAVLDTVARIAARHIVDTLNTTQAQELCKRFGLGKVAPCAAMKERAAEQPFATAGAVLALRDTGYAHWYADREDYAHNPTLIALAEACGVDVEAIKAQTQANLRADKAATAPQPDAPKADLPQSPAARAGGVDARGKAKKSKKPAAQADETPKTSAAHASAQIAEALQGLQEPGAATAAQGNDGAPVADAQAPTTGADALGDEAAPVAAGAAQELPPSSAAAEDSQAASDDEQQPSAANPPAGRKKPLPPEELLGENIRILPSATGKNQKFWIGYEGTVVAIVGPEAVDVSIPRAPRCKPIRVAFHISEVEVLQ